MPSTTEKTCHHVLAGHWDAKDSKYVNQSDRHTSDEQWLAAYVHGDEKSVTLGVTNPGVHTLYYAVLAKAGRIIWGETKRYIQSRLDRVGTKVTIHQVASGTEVVFDGHAVTITALEPTSTPPTINDSLETAVETTEAILKVAVTDMLDNSDKHVVCLSGGTDSLLVAAMLKQLGARDLVAISVGSSPLIFDVAYAKQYAEQLGIPFVFLQLPDDKAALRTLATRTVREYENCDISNTYMGMCNLLIRDWAEDNGYAGIWQGYYADRLLGHSLTMKSNFLKRVADRPSSDTWVDYRWNLYHHITNNDEQVAKTLRGPKTYWRSPYLHRELREYVTRLGANVVPYGYKAGKPLLELLADKFVTDGSWKVGKKKGYYTGAGVGELTKKHGINADVLQNIHKRIKIFG